MSDIFISYARQDRARIEPFVEVLEARGWSVFWDTTLLPGETWRKKISSELDAAKCVIVLWSEGSVESHFVQEEAERGRQRGILVPAMIDLVTIPLGFGSLQAANLVGWDGAAGHGELAKMLRATERYAPVAKLASARGAAGSISVAPTVEEDAFVTIPGGAFWMGAQSRDKNGRNYDPEASDEESPVRQVTLKTFRVARFPVTVKEFARFIDSGGYRVEKRSAAVGFSLVSGLKNWAAQLKSPEWPVVGVSWFEAAAYCAWAGLRLPTEAEWERVARGPTSARYAWGDNPPLDESRANYDRKIGHPTPAGQYPNGRSAEGIDDLLGNVWEWCSDSDSEYPKNPQSRPVRPTMGESKSTRGGSWSSDPRGVRASGRLMREPSKRFGTLGLRCVGELN